MQFEILDLTPQYIQSQGLGLQGYFETYPLLFQHYYRFWSHIEGKTALPEDVVREKANLIRSRLHLIQQAFTKKRFSETIPIILFVGEGTTNGHAFWDELRQAFIVWLPVEAYATSRQVDVFVTHEIIHALHYSYQHEFYFHNRREKNLVGRQVITEGIATWGTIEVMGFSEVAALWADYVSPAFARQWYSQCRHHEREMASRILREWWDSNEANELFAMWDENDVTKYRGGYYLGLHVIQRVVRRGNFDLSSLLRLDAMTLEALVIAELERTVAPQSA